jgi:hypothetical protein
MPSRSRRPDPPSSRPNPTLIAIVLVVIGATVALGAERLAAPGAASPTAPPAASALASADPLADSSAFPSDYPSDAPSDGPSASPVAPQLEAAMPHSVSNTTLTVESDLGSAILGSDPGSRSFAAAISTLGVTSDNLEVAFAYDEAGALPLTVIGFRLPGVAVAKLKTMVLQAWLSTLVPGVKSADATVGGLPATKVTYSDNGADEYVYIRGDAVFIAETTDVNLATAAIGATKVPAPEASVPASSTRPAASASPAAS